jgi:hypothetical protein
MFVSPTYPIHLSASAHPARAELLAMGKALRDRCPRTAHAVWQPAPNRPDPLELLAESSKGRIPQLVPIRYGRMMQTPFTFYRGAALNMAADLAVTPQTGLRVQACGDAHLLNFGAYATPERRVVFDLNDLDETLPAPWEWDVKRLAASFLLACRNNRFSDAVARGSALACVRSYREAMAQFSGMRTLDVWYATLDFERIIPQIEDEVTRKRAEKMLVGPEATHGKVSRAVDSLFGISLTPGGSVHTVLRAARRCESVYAAICQTVGQSDRVVLDETGWHVGGHNAWLHTLVGPEATAYVIDPTRSGAVAERILGADYAGVLIHDGWSPYDTFAHARHQQCLQHLIRRADEMAATATGGPSVSRAGWPSCSGQPLTCVTATRREGSVGTDWPWPAAAWRTDCPT